MRNQEHVPQIVDATDARDAFGTWLDTVVAGRRRVVVRENGRDLAALISAADLARLEALDRHRAEGWKVVEELHARFSHIDPEEIERDIAEAIAEVRAEAPAKTPTSPRT